MEGIKERVKERVRDRSRDRSDDDEEEEVVIMEMQPTSKLCSSSDDEDGTEISIDSAFEKAGRFRWFQIRQLLLLLLFHVPVAFHILAIEFAGLTPEWTCMEYAEHTYNNSVKAIEDENCDLYNNANCTVLFTDRFHSIAQEWDLICDESVKINLTQSGFFLGFLIGSYILGTIGDLIGRRKVTIFFLIGLALVQTMISLSPNYYIFALGRFLVGFLVPGGITWYVLMCEVSGPAQRSLIAVTQAAVFGLSFGLMSLFAYILPNWRWFTAAIAIMSAIDFLITVSYVPESPRWLLVNGKELEARQAMMDIAKINNRSLPSGFTLKLPQKPKSSSSLNFIALFKTWKIRIRMLLLMLEWFTVCMTYYGLSLGVGNLSSNIYLAFTLSGLVEIPSNFLTLVVLEKIGRKWTNEGLLLIGGAASLCCCFIQFTGVESSGGYFQLGLSLLGKFAVAGSFSVLYTYTPELIPTNLRSSGMGVVNVCARLGGILAPLVILLDSRITTGLSMLIFGGISTVCGILTVYLPETLNTALPNTLVDIK